MSDGWGDLEAPPVALARGPWSAELRTDELADVAFRGQPVLRSIRAVVRDRDWNTVPVEVTSTRDLDNGILLDLAFVGLGADIAAQLRIRMTGDTLTVEFAADNRRDFERNRIGLVVLHPPHR